MTSSEANATSFIMDADVLIDFLAADRSVLTLIIDHVGMVHVERQVVRQI